MSRRDIVRVTGAVIRWARQRAKLEPEALAKKLGKGYTADHVVAWETGTAFPTFGQAEKLADQLRIPFGILFMAKPPVIHIPIPDRRVVAGTPQGVPSLEFLDVINDCLIRQAWYRDDQAQSGALKLAFIGRFTDRDNVSTVADDIAETLSLNDVVRKDCQTWEGFLGIFIERLEAAGIMVMRNSIVGYSTNRGLSVDEFRGFAISDSLAPLIFVNGKDSRSAQIFTLAHEVAHLWIGQSAISNPNPKTAAGDLKNAIEIFCNKVAAELLVPEKNVNNLWRLGISPEANVAQIAVFHRVSRTVAAIRARDLNRISLSAANKIIDNENERFAATKQKAKEREGGPGFWTLFGGRNSPRLLDAVVNALREGRVFYRDAANLLGLKAEKLQSYVETR